MLDNFKHNKEAEAAFLNESWDKMSAMLDAEIPVANATAPKETNRYRSLVGLLLLLLLAGGGSLYWTLNDTYLLSEKTRLIDLKNDNSEKENSNKILIENSGKSSVLESTVVFSESPESTDVLHENRTKDSNPISNSQATADSKFIKSVGARIAVAASVRNAASSVSNNTLTSNDLTDRKEINLVKPSQKVTLLELPSKDHPLIEETIPQKTGALIKPVESKPSLKFGIIAGLQQEKFNLGFGGFHLGALISKGLANNFTLEAGVHFSATQFNKTSVHYAPPAITFDQPAQPDLTGVEENLTLTYAPSDAEPTDFIQLGSAYWLSLPIQMTYQPLPKWRVNMGVEYAQLLAANQQKLFGNTNDKSGSVTDLIAYNNISALTGLTWFPQKNFGIDIRYQFGFTDLFKANPDFVDQTDTRAALQWSLVYYFNN